jgi:hypothetical protein
MTLPTRWITEIIFLLILTSCTPLIGPHSPMAYQNATSLKASTLALMDKATEPYSNHMKDIESLMLEVDKAYEFVNGIPSNNISGKQWYILKKPDGNLLGKFFLRWKEKNTLSRPYIDEFKKLISDAYDEIICLEANKLKPSKCHESRGQ